MGKTWVIYFTPAIDMVLRIVGAASLAVIAGFLIWWLS